jgi:hypothetical protein
LAKSSSPPDQHRAHVRGFGHPGEVERLVDIVELDDTGVRG